MIISLKAASLNCYIYPGHDTENIYFFPLSFHFFLGKSFFTMGMRRYLLKERDNEYKYTSIEIFLWYTVELCNNALWAELCARWLIGDWNCIFSITLFLMKYTEWTTFFCLFSDVMKLFIPNIDSFLLD